MDDLAQLATLSIIVGLMGWFVAYLAVLAFPRDTPKRLSALGVFLILYIAYAVVSAAS